MEDKNTSFVKQAAILASAGILARFLGFLYRVPLTNLILDIGNGYYSAGYNLYLIFLIISSAGLPAAISKMVSERIKLKQYRNAHRVFRVALMIAGASGFVSMLVLAFSAKALANFVETPESYYSILTLAPTVFIVAIMAVFRGYFQGMNSTVPTAISQVLEQVFNATFSLVFAFMLIDKGLEFAAAGGTAGTGVGAIVGLMVLLIIYHRKKPAIMKNVRLDKNHETSEHPKKIAMTIIKTAVPIIIGVAVFSFTNIIDNKMVKGRLAASKAFDADTIKALFGQLSGKYVTLTTLPVSIATAFATAAVPNIASSAITDSRKVLNKKINMILKLTMIISIPAAVGIGVLGDQILLLLFPKAFQGGILLKVGALSIIFLALAQIVTGMLQGLGHVALPAIAAIIGVSIKIPINYFLIVNPKINVVGAVISTTACYIVASMIDLYFLSRATKTSPDLIGAFVKPAFASLIMGLSCYVAYYVLFFYIPNNTVAILFAIVVAIVVYFMMLLLLNGLTEEDLKMIPFGNRVAPILKIFQLL